jgi:SAM-dependent methyltransferase
MTGMDPTGGYIEYGFVADFYDWVPPYRDRSDVGFFVSMARESGGPVLELGCGTGRILVPTAEAGIEIVGLDLSKRMLEGCRRRLAGKSEEVRDRVRLVEGEMRDFDLGRTFALITTPFRPFQHLIETEDQISCLRAIHRHLVDGGRLILDLFNPSLHYLVDESHAAEFGDEPSFPVPDGRTVLRRFRMVGRDLCRQVNDVEMIYYVTHPDGREERLVHRFPMRYLFRYEAEHLLARCGFDVDAVYADYERNPFGSKYPGELILVARKAGKKAGARR